MPSIETSMTSDFEILIASNNSAISTANCSIVKFLEPEVDYQYYDYQKLS
ncbi:MAG TPA: hypothetical protein VJ697_05595 [Nitrososphaeraceae archaeon]|nr:hypothetical protein [Nitrososphaeraceae archaeon]